MLSDLRCSCSESKVGNNCYRISGPKPTTRSLPSCMMNDIDNIREEGIVHMDIAIYKSIAYDRIEEIKNETYGKRTFNKNDQTMNWKMTVSMFLNAFV